MEKEDLNTILKGQKEQRGFFQESLDAQSEKFQKSLDVQGEKFQRHLGVVIEEQNSKIQFLAESVGGIDKKINVMDKKIDRNTEMIGRSAMNIEIIKGDIQFIKQELGYKVGKDKFNALEKRVMFLENKLNKA